MDYHKIYTQVLDINGCSTPRIGMRKSGSREFVCGCSSFEKRELIKKLYSLENAENFNRAFDEVTQGPGKELRRITTLHSSSLLGLLVFYDVSENNPAIINGVKYTRTFFEVKNKAFASASSVDVVLVSQDKANILFLELKFTEFLNTCPYYWLKKDYHELYNKISKLLNNAGILVSEMKERQHRHRNKSVTSSHEFKIEDASQSRRYFHGIKQMISHLISVMQSPATNYIELRKLIDAAPKPHILLGTMLYKHSGTFLHEFEDYYRLYKEIFAQENINQIVNSIRGCSNIVAEYEVELLPIPLTYQNDLKGECGDFHINEQVRNFYKLV
ncbi:MAG: hypothetical protein K2L84_10550 [Muribaculaceae bacterium]|nr:hypothetical protein [Muribaculaceae bacterium]